MRDEREQKRDDAEPGVQSRRDQQFRETEQPDKTLSPAKAWPQSGRRFPDGTRGFSAGPLGNMPDLILLGFSAGILLREESVDKQKSSLPVQEK